MNPDSTNSRAPAVRIAKREDIPVLVPLINAAFAIETFLEGTRTDEVRLAATMQKGEILVAEGASGTIVGCVFTEIRGPRGYLGQLAVDPDHQGSGLGRLLVEAGENQLRGNGREWVDISVLSLRPELLPIYRRYGYVETGTEEFRMSRSLIGAAECHCIVMSKKL